MQSRNFRNQKDTDRGRHVKFISYTGKWPSLCVGVLTLKIDEEYVTFGPEHKKTMYSSFWHSGGYETGTCERWIIDEEKIPEQYRKHVGEITYLFNKNVERGCCGGCRQVERSWEV